MDNAWIIYNRSECEKNEFFIDRMTQTMAERDVILSLVTKEEFESEGFESLEKKYGCPTFAINRSRADDIAETLELRGIRVYNSSIVTKIANDKWKTYKFAKECKVPVIETSLLPVALDEKIIFPQIIKKRSSHGGTDVFQIKTHQELTDWKKREDAEQYIIQRAVQPGKDVRAYLLGNNVIISMLRENDKDFRANYSLGGKASETSLTDQQWEIVKKISSNLDADLIGVDFVFDGDDVYLNEIEDVVGARMVYTEADVDIIKEYGHFILSKEAELKTSIEKMDKIIGSGLNHVIINVDGELPAHTPTDGISISKEAADKLSVSKGENLFLFNQETKKFVQCRVIITDSKKDFASVRIRKFKELITDGEYIDKPVTSVIAVKVPHIAINEVNAQKIGSIGTGEITISKNIMEQCSFPKTEYYALRHSTYGNTFVFSKDKMKVDEALKDDSIKLNKFQRQLLGWENPIHNVIECLCTKKEAEKCKCKNGTESEELKLIDQDIETLKAIDDKGEQYEKKETLEGIVHKHHVKKELILFPLLLTDKKHTKEKMGTKVSNFFVGKGDIILLCGRPYKSDEDRNIVRLSSDNMKLLGVNESDIVRIESAHSSVRVGVFSFDDEVRIKETNRCGSFVDNDLLCGVPLGVRDGLEISDLGTSAVIKRDTLFVFKKNLNIQLISLILFFISIYQISSSFFLPTDALVFSLIAIVMGYPLVLFALLSRERASVRWKKKVDFQKEKKDL